MTASAAPFLSPMSMNHTAKVVFMYSLKSMYSFLLEMSKWYVYPLISIWRRNKQTNPLHSTCNFMCVKRRENIFWLWRTCIWYYHGHLKAQRDVQTLESGWGGGRWGKQKQTPRLLAALVALISGQKAVSEPSAVCAHGFLHLSFELPPPEDLKGEK